MNRDIRKHIELFLSGFVLVILAAINTWQLAHEKYFDSFIFGFLSAFVWSITVKRVVLAKTVDRVIYALGAAIGGVVGLCIVKLLYNT